MATRKKRPAREPKKRPPIVNWLKAEAEGDPRAITNPAEIVRRANAGDQGAARSILILLYIALLRCPKKGWSKSLEGEYATYLADAIEKILEGNAADSAFGTKHSKAGRPPSEEIDKKHEAIAAAVALLIRYGHPKRRIVEWFEANSGYSKRTIQRAIEENGWAFEAEQNDNFLSDNFLTVVASPVAPLMQEFLGARRRR